MYKELIFPLVKYSDRPMLRLSRKLIALYDTGANLPVWTDEEDILTEEFHAELVSKDHSFHGFGGDTIGRLYRMTFCLGELTFPNMPILATDDKAFLEAPYSMILSATMLNGLAYYLDTRDHLMRIEIEHPSEMVRNLKVDGKVLTEGMLL